MAAPESTRFQVNYKLSDGSLINLYATTIQELETGLNDLSMVSALIKSTSADLGGSSHTAPTVASVAAAFNTTAVTPSGAPAQSAGNTCKHGPMAYKTGTSSKGAWQGWMCPTPKGAPDKCDTIWVR
jgi:membrane carboxypeptidase/penicillin-binding protein PbpC